MRRGGPRWAQVGFCLIAAAVAYGLFRLAVRPAMVAEARRVEDEVARMNARAQASAAGHSGSEVEEAAELVRELGRVEERVAALSGMLATPAEAEAVLRSLGATASEAGVRFVRFAPEPAYRLDGYVATAVSVVAEGTFFEFLHFFERVSLAPHLVLVEEVTLEQGVDDLLQGRFVAVTVRPAEAVVAQPNARDGAAAGPAPEEPVAEEVEN